MNPMNLVRCGLFGRRLSPRESIPLVPAPSNGFWSRIAATPLSDLLRGRLSASLDLRRVVAEARLPEPLAGLAYETARRGAFMTAARVALARDTIEHLRAGLVRGLSADALVQSLLACERSPEPSLAMSRVTLADLPAEVADTIERTTRYARLWPKERDDVREELAAHFRDGLAGGVSPAELIAGFGDLRNLARLIRRAKRRNRPLVYRVFRRTCQVVGATTAAAVLLYICLAVRFFGSSPNIAHNFISDVNAEARSVPPDDRAWPLYRAALLKLPKEKPDGDDFRAGPKGERWADVVAFLHANRDALSLARQATAKPRLGFVFGDPENREFLARYSGGPAAHGESPDRYKPEYIAIVIPQAQEMRTLFHLFQADARQAASQGNGEVVRLDVEAMLKMAKHTRETLPCLVADLVALAIQQGAIQTVFEVLAETPDVFSDSDLKLLAHVFAANASAGQPQVSLDGERMMMDDVLQRVFSDNGAGDGHLTRAGLANLQHYAAIEPDDAIWLLGPVVSAVIASRRETHDLAARWFDGWEAERHRPLWQWRPSIVDAEFNKVASGLPGKLHYMPLVLLLPAAESAYFVRETRVQEQDAVLTVIALELYHRLTHEWPSSLAKLTPGLLPTVPVDRFTGEPLCYRVIDGHPLLYSRGTDCDDDGGVMPKEGNRVARTWDASARLGSNTVTTAWATAHDGDWLLWPPVPETAK